VTRLPRAGLAGRVGLRVAASLALAGCIAGVREERAYGPAHPADSAASPVQLQRREGETGPECRRVAWQPMVREVNVQRSFVDSGPIGAQATNLGLAGIFGAAAVLIGYDLSTLACSQNNDTGCDGQTQPGAARAEALAIGLAAIPTAFLVINALRVQGRTFVEPSRPEITRTDWAPCEP
jgi:hypothetical protein